MYACIYICGFDACVCILETYVLCSGCRCPHLLVIEHENTSPHDPNNKNDNRSLSTHSLIMDMCLYNLQCVEFVYTSVGCMSRDIPYISIM